MRHPHLVRFRVFQCPGCWNYMSVKVAPDVEIECDCGQRMALVDLRGAVTVEQSGDSNAS